MIVTAALVWYNEKPEDLERCVRGVANVADRIVAVDGAYRRYPNAKPRSPREQERTIRRVGKACGLEAITYTPSELWAGQVAKRSFTLQRAAEESDWIAVVDTDWVVSGDREAVRAELEGYGPEIDVVSVPFSTPKGGTFATNWHRKDAGKTYDLPHFYRALPGIQVETLHWWYSALKDGKRVWLWHGPVWGKHERPVLPTYRLQAPYRIEHRFIDRTEQQILDGRAFCNDREMVMRRTGQEDHVEGLPEPEFDYTTIPY